MKSRFPVHGLLLLSGAFVTFSLVGGACTGDPGNGSTSSSSSTGGTTSSSTTGTESSSAAQASSAAGSSSSAGATSAAGNSSSRAGQSSSFDFSNFDAGFAPYMGEPDEGVECGADHCGAAGGPAGSCCIPVFGGAPACGAMCQFGQIALACDGPEDCGMGEVCCFSASGGGRCATEANCPRQGSGLSQQTWLCNATADCPMGSGCCRSAYLEDYNVGTCIDGCNVQ